MRQQTWIRRVFRRLGVLALEGVGVAALTALVFLAVAPVWPAAERMARQGGTAAPPVPVGVLVGTLGAAAALVLVGFVVRAREGRR